MRSDNILSSSMTADNSSSVWQVYKKTFNEALKKKKDVAGVSEVWEKSFAGEQNCRHEDEKNISY